MTMKCKIYFTVSSVELMYSLKEYFANFLSENNYGFYDVNLVSVCSSSYVGGKYNCVIRFDFDYDVSYAGCEFIDNIWMDGLVMTRFGVNSFKHNEFESNKFEKWYRD